MSGIAYVEQRSMSQAFATAFLEVSSTIEGCRSLDEVEGAIASTAASHGFFLYLIADPKVKALTLRPLDSPLFCNWPIEWRSRYVGCNYVHQDPVARRAKVTCDPFVWRYDATDGQNELEVEFMNEAASFGLRSGLCIPIRIAGSSMAGAILGGTHVDISASAIQKIQALVLLVRDKSSRLTYSHSGASRRLSNRERQILTWTALGKSAWDISCIVSISEVTVHKHIGSAMRKLNAANKTHAVVVAILAEEIVL